MPRIRSIKPQLPQDAKLAKVARDARLTFLYLLTVVDDEGYFRAAPRLLLGELFPHDEGVTEAMLASWLDELAGSGLVAMFDSDDGPLGHVVNFLKHQKIPHPTFSYLGSLSRQPRAVIQTTSRPLHDQVATLSVLESRSPESRSQEVGVSEGHAPRVETEPDALFLEAWKAYPKRLGGNPRKTALTAWQTRVRQGVFPATLLAGVRRYAKFVRSTGKEGTAFVFQGATFFGPNEHWAESYALGAGGNGTSRQAKNEAAIEAGVDAWAAEFSQEVG